MSKKLESWLSRERLRVALPWVLLGGGALTVDGLASWGQLNGGAAAPLLWMLLQAVLLLAAWAFVLQQVRRGPSARVHVGWALLLALFLSANFLWAALPHAGTAWRQIQPSSTQPQLRIESQDQGRTLRLQGPLQSGDAARLISRMNSEAALVRLDLALEGGAMGEARQIAAAVSERGLQTRLVGRCERDCVLIFLAGSKRQVLPSGLLALQRLDAPSLNPLWVHWLRSAQRKLYLDAGLPVPLVTKLLLSPAPFLRDTGVPEMRIGKLIGQTRFALDIDLPPEPGASSSEYQQALSSNSYWLLLERRFPGLTQLATDRMMAVRAKGGSEEAALETGHALAVAGVQQMLGKLGPEVRLLYLQLLDAQLAGLKSDADCQALLSGDVKVRRRLPVELSQREADWIETAALEPVPDQAARRFSSLEAEVLRRSVGLTRMHELARLWGPDGGTRPGCASARSSLAQLQALPGPQRHLALRRVFD
ncbi:MAG: hypothetical protein ACOVN9_06340 [Inhella sp.]